MTKIECNGCGDQVEVTACSVCLPYVCDSCQQAGYGCDDEISLEEVLGTNQKYEDMAPAPVDDCGTPLGNTTEALIADLKAQNESLLKEVEFCNRRVRQYQQIAKQEGVLRVSAESLLNDYRKKPAEASLSNVKAALEQSQKEVLEYQKEQDDLRYVIKSLRTQFATSEKALDVIRRAVVAVSL
jgi:hypothetical protein